ncbi:hypothetical protein FKZ69_14205 [Pseudomonas azotoformans]|nr:hypothetical protein FKZ69_14205 [Pseudomonas azotoformans]
MQTEPGQCGRGLAPDSGLSGGYSVADTPLSGASPLPQFDLHQAQEVLMRQIPNGICGSSRVHWVLPYQVQR